MYSSTGDEIRTALTYIVVLVYHVIQSAILEHGRFNTTKIVLWCNGNTSDFGSEISSSNLGRTTITLIYNLPANLPAACIIIRRVRTR